MLCQTVTKLSKIALDIKETIWDCAIGMKSRCVGHRFLKQTKNRVSDWSFQSNAIAC